MPCRIRWHRVCSSEYSSLASLSRVAGGNNDDAYDYVDDDEGNWAPSVDRIN